MQPLHVRAIIQVFSTPLPQGLAVAIAFPFGEHQCMALKRLAFFPTHSIYGVCQHLAASLAQMLQLCVSLKAKPCPTLMAGIQLMTEQLAIQNAQQQSLQQQMFLQQVSAMGVVVRASVAVERPNPPNAYTQNPIHIHAQILHNTCIRIYCAYTCICIAYAYTCTHFDRIFRVL